MIKSSLDRESAKSMDNAYNEYKREISEADIPGLDERELEYNRRSEEFVRTLDQQVSGGEEDTSGSLKGILMTQMKLNYNS